MSEWQDIETAPKGGGADYVTDPKWVDPPTILMRFGGEGVALVSWDWYYAEGGNGHRGDNSAWVIDRTGETSDLHFTTEPTQWMHIPTHNPEKEE